MRPLMLKMTGFGPYAGEVTIPMEELGTSGLYLVTGDTGAGKTTIFDAICFALFGEPSGTNREASMFRSKYADPDTPTEVELIFSHGGKEYRIKRNPEYLRPSKRGTGEKKQAADAELFLPSGRIITKSREVTSSVEKILGINREQFSQISMLAQGDFLKLLLADTRQRQEIFRELFKTGLYSTLQNELEAKRKEIYGVVEDGRKSVNQYINDIAVNEDDVLSMEVSAAKEGGITTEEVLELIDRLLTNDTEAIVTIKEELDNVNQTLSSVNSSIGAAETVEKTKADLAHEEAELINETPLEEEYRLAFEKAKEALKDKDKLTKEAAGIEGDMPSFDSLEKLNKEIADTKKQIEEYEKKLSSISDSKESITKKLADSKEQQAALKDAGANLEKNKNLKEKYEEELNDLSDLEETYEEYLKLKEALAKAQGKYAKADAEFKTLAHRHEQMEQAFRDGQAGILAASLQDGEMCPVCGSTTHPKKAVLTEDIPDKEDLEAAKEEAESARSLANAASLASGTAKAQLEAKTEEIKKLAKAILKTEDIEKVSEGISAARGTLAEKLTKTEEKIETEEKNLRKKEAIEEEIPRLEAELENLAKEVMDLTSGAAAGKEKLSEKEKNVTDISSKLKFSDRKSAEKRIKELNDLSESLQKDYEKRDRAAKAQSEKIIGISSKIQSLKKTLENAAEYDLADLRGRKALLEEKQAELSEKHSKVNSRLTTNTGVRDNIKKQADNILKTEKKLQWITSLSSTANGKIAGKEKIMLETYIQTTFFDRIINRANLRLMTMSGGQYELKRQLEASNARSQSGLELCVIDHYNGSERSVKTLSGGESFMASLSLALGLSDEVQSSAGGIQVDTMFVDEGFGSLDPDSLDLAYSALAGLTEGNKLVGIISHVSDLKDKIDRQIIVTKEKSGGSHIKLLA